MEGGDSERRDALANPRKPGRVSSSSLELMSATFRFWPAKPDEGDSIMVSGLRK
jgi:hypothetical protein